VLSKTAQVGEGLFRYGRQEGHKTLEHASDMIDEIGDKHEKE